MLKTEISPLHWGHIIKQIHKGDCVPFLGAAVNKSCEGYEGLPLGRDVALYLLKEALALSKEELEELTAVTSYKKLTDSLKYKDLAQAQFYNLARVASHVELELDEQAFIDLLKSIIAEERCIPSRILNTLAQLPFKLIITTNYDQLMEEALRLHNKVPKVIIQAKNGFSSEDQKKMRNELLEYNGLVLYKIHGTFSTRDELSYIPSRIASPQIIITEDDYIAYLTVVGIKNKGMPNLVKEKLGYGTLLFLGYGLEDWDFRTIFKGLIEPLPKNEKRQSFAIQKDPSEFWVDFWEKKGVKLYNVDLYVFAAELEKRYKQYIAGL